MFHELRDSPKRAPNWRWLRAVQIDSGGPRASSARDGAEGFTWIRRASRLKRRFEQAASRPEILYRLIQNDAALFWAHAMWLDDKAPARWSVEARILAGETDKQIADRMGIDESVVQAYAAVFFNVRERLANRDYIVNVVMADAVTRGLTERQYDLLWKLFGYHGGIYVLDAVISKVSPIDKPTNAAGVGTFFQDFAVNTVKHKAAIATLTIPINTYTQIALIESFVKYVEIEKNSENAGKAHSTIVENIGAMMAALPFKVGTKLDSVDAKMLPYDDSAAELSSAELMTVAAGGKLSNQQDIENLRFPTE
jgi:hypothetical protein